MFCIFLGGKIDGLYVKYFLVLDRDGPQPLVLSLVFSCNAYWDGLVSQVLCQASSMGSRTAAHLVGKEGGHAWVHYNAVEKMKAKLRKNHVQKAISDRTAEAV